MRSVPVGRQRGVVLLLSLVLTLAGAGAWLALHPPHHAPMLPALSAVLDRHRQRHDLLLSYTTLYADHYGPLGAGPGHLPCPDRSGADVQPLGALRRWGPDPPCAQRPIAFGTLPAHVTIGELRLALDPFVGLQPRPGYRVASQVVNNPLGRPITANSLPSVMATLSVPWRTDSPVELPVRSSATRSAVQRRVDAWLAMRLAERGVAAVQFESTDCAASVSCAWLERLAPEQILQGVPLQRHWFVRNGWHLADAVGGAR